MRFNEQDASATEEKRVVMGLIVSTEVCKQLTPHIQLDYFKNKYLSRVATWALAFYEEHGKASYTHINDIFQSEAHSMKDTEVELIDALLTKLGSQYDPEIINVDYFVTSAEEYFRSRELEITSNNISVLTEQGDLEGAEEEILRFNKVSVKLDENIYINPGDLETINRIYKKRDEQQASFFELPGDMGKYLDNMKPEDVVGITAPAKRGKSFLLNEFNKQAVLSKKKCLKWSIEMTDTEELERFHKAFFPMVDKEEGMYSFPVFDCLLNQTGDCGDRLSEVILREEPTDEPEHNPDHVICTKCRNCRDNHSRFIPVVYMDEIHREDNSIFTVRKRLKTYQKLLSKYSRIVVRPKYSLTYDLMMRDLDVMDSRDGFIPQILILDYIDILSINSQHDDFKLEDEKWKLLQKIAGATKCLVITATQANKEGAKAEVLHSTDQGGYYGKSRHVNKMITINQTSGEKRQGLWRLGISDARSSHQNYEDICIVLQDLKAGQMYLDSYWGGKFIR